MQFCAEIKNKHMKSFSRLYVNSHRTKQKEYDVNPESNGDCEDGITRMIIKKRHIYACVYFNLDFGAPEKLNFVNYDLHIMDVGTLRLFA